MHDPQADIATIRQLVAGAADLMRARDFDAIAGAYTARGKLLLPGRPTASGFEGLREAWAGFVDAMPGLDLDYGPEDIEIAAAGDIAVELGRYRLTWDGPDGRLRDEGKYIVTWKREGGDWRIDLDILNSDLPQPVSA